MMNITARRSGITHRRLGKPAHRTVECIQFKGGGVRPAAKSIPPDSTLIRVRGMSTVAKPLLSPELLAQLERLELVSRKIFRGRMKGERRSKRKGQSVEFADFRNYVAGDDLRFIDWNTYARLDKLFLKMFLEEEDLHFYALIDASRSMDFGDAHQAALRQATGRGAGLHRPGAGRPRADRNARPAAQPARARAARPAQLVADGRLSRRHSSRARLPRWPTGSRTSACATRGKGIVVLISDLMDKQGYEAAFRYLVVAADGRLCDSGAVAPKSSIPT